MLPPRSKPTLYPELDDALARSAYRFLDYPKDRYDYYGVRVGVAAPFGTLKH